jgi:hypothetical protein
VKIPATLLLIVPLIATRSASLDAHSTEARRVVVLSSKQDRITRVLGANRSETQHSTISQEMPHGSA